RHTRSKRDWSSDVCSSDLAQRKSLLDVGTGSGILAIAGAKLGFDPIVALDLDPAAVRIARANAVQNGVERIVRVSRRDLTRLPRSEERRVGKEGRSRALPE